MIDSVKRRRHVQQQKGNAFLIIHLTENVILHFQKCGLRAVRAFVRRLGRFLCHYHESNHSIDKILPFRLSLGLKLE